MQELAYSQDQQQPDVSTIYWLNCIIQKLVYESVLSPLNPPTMNGVASNVDLDLYEKKLPETYNNQSP